MSVFIIAEAGVNHNGSIELAKKIGKSTTALSQIINGVYEPNPETLDKICEVLEVPKAIVYFLTISEKDVPKDWWKTRISPCDFFKTRGRNTRADV